MSREWTNSEKKVARALFDKALQNAQEELLSRHHQTKFTDLGELWDYEFEIRKWRKDFDMVFQYAYSRLDVTFVFTLQRGWLQEEDIKQLREEHAAQIIAMHRGEYI